MREAYAWLQNRLVGRFFKGSDDVTRFEYAPEASAPISLSLPLDGSWQADVPGAFLDGLLPDNDSEREAMRRWFGAASADPLDLLVATDVTGGLCFTSVPDLGEITSQAREFAREKDIAIKVYRLGRGWTTWQSDDRRSREIYVNFHGEKLKQNLQIVEVLKHVAANHGKTVAACAIRWILDTMPDSVVIAGVKRPSQLASNAEALGWHLDEAEIKKLNEVSE